MRSQLRGEAAVAARGCTRSLQQSDVGHGCGALEGTIEQRVATRNCRLLRHSIGSRVEAVEGALEGLLRAALFDGTSSGQQDIEEAVAAPVEAVDTEQHFAHRTDEASSQA